ncbi:MAG TPA: hypothetical protein PKW56_05905 [Clostridiales bacterium]|nr:hypothetical protein [Clostridiales bacterium]
MKKIFVLVSLVFIIVFTGCSGKTEAKKTADSDIAKKYAPENTVAMLRFSSAQKLFTTFGAGPDSFMGEPVPADRSEVVEVLGFDPMNPAEYDKAGLDINREFGIVVSGLNIKGNEGEETSADIDILFPVTDGQKAYTRLKEVINSKKDETTTVTEENGMLIIIKSGEEDVKVTVKNDAAYLVFRMAFNSASTAQDVFAAGKKLADNPNYKETASSVNIGSDIGFYIDFKNLFMNNEEALKKLSLNPVFAENNIKSLEYMKYYRGAGFSVDLEKSDFAVNMAAYIDAGNPFQKMIENVKADRSVVLGMKKNPALLFSAFLNASEYMSFILETLPLETKQSYEQELVNIKNQTGIDLKTEIIDQLAGSINLGMYDGSTINMMNYNTVLNFNVKDPGAFIATLEKIGPMANMTKADPAQTFTDIEIGGNVSVYSVNIQMMMAYIVIDGNNVSFCTSKEMAADALNKKDKPFTDNIDGELKKQLENDQSCLYLDIDETYIAAKSIYQFFVGISGGESIIDAKTDAFAGKFDYLYAGGEWKGEKAESRLVLKTRFSKPFFIALQEEIAKLKQ